MSPVPCSQKSHRHLHMVMTSAFFTKRTPTVYGLSCISRKLHTCLLHHSKQRDIGFFVVNVIASVSKLTVAGLILWYNVLILYEAFVMGVICS